MSQRKLPVVREEEMEGLCGVSIESASAFYDDDSGNLAVIGELVASSGVLKDEYREVHVVVHDVDGDVVGRDYSNWGSFGFRQSFELSFDESDDLYGTPSSVRVFPASPFATAASVEDSEFTEPSGNPNCGPGLSFALEPATVDHERLAYIAECFSHERTPTEVASFRTTVSITFGSDDFAEIARLLNVQASCLSQAAAGIVSLEGDLRADADVNGQIAALLSRTTDDLAAWRELVEEHSAGLTVDITTSNWPWSLLSDVVLAIGERGLGLGGWIWTEGD